MKLVLPSLRKALLTVLLLPLVFSCSTVHKTPAHQKTIQDSVIHAVTVTNTTERVDTTVNIPPDSLVTEVPFVDTAVHIVQSGGLKLAVQFVPRKPGVGELTGLGGSPMLDVDIKALSTPPPLTLSMDKTTFQTTNTQTQVKAVQSTTMVQKTKTGMPLWGKMGIVLVLLLVIVLVAWRVCKKFSLLGL